MAVGVSVEEEIRAVAGMASLALALLGLFTNIRRDSLKEYEEKIRPLSSRTIAGAVPDLALALCTAGAVVAMAPLCFDSFDLGDLGRRSGAVPSMFALIWIGFVLLLCFQLSMIWRRFWPAAKARVSDFQTRRKAKAAA